MGVFRRFDRKVWCFYWSWWIWHEYCNCHG